MNSPLFARDFDADRRARLRLAAGQPIEGLAHDRDQVPDVPDRELLDPSADRKIASRKPDQAVEMMPDRVGLMMGIW